jgi:hypothetical protein
MDFGSAGFFARAGKRAPKIFVLERREDFVPPEFD